MEVEKEKKERRKERRFHNSIYFFSFPKQQKHFRIQTLLISAKHLSPDEQHVLHMSIDSGKSTGSTHASFLAFQ
jgi:hypothetical protein